MTINNDPKNGVITDNWDQIDTKEYNVNTA